jgi:hypothetical protein
VMTGFLWLLSLAPAAIVLSAGVRPFACGVTLRTVVAELFLCSVSHVRKAE